VARTTERIRILRAMAGGAGLPRYNEAFRTVTGRPVGVVPFSALQDAPHVGAAAPSAPDASSRLERVRQTTDMLWRLNQYVTIACACGTTLKVPPAYLGRDISCPHCGEVHRVQAPAA
jgi:heat shock protein HtpX